MTNTSIKTLALRLLGRDTYRYLLYRRHYRSLLRQSGFSSCRVDGEEAYRAQWGRIAQRVDPYSYRLFSHYCGPTPDIVPEDILHRVVEPALSPRRYWEEYEDKNNFGRIVGEEWLPQTVASCQRGKRLGDVESLTDCPFSSLILKASTGTSCGDGIMKFDRVGERYYTTDGCLLSERLLQNYGSDYVLQEAVCQHPFTAQFNATSVNTFRMAAYRSLTDGRVHLTAAVLRIGRSGAWVDNALAGGRYVGVDMTTGVLGSTTFTHLGQPSKVWNGVDFSATRYVVPGWEAVCRLAVHVGERLPHARLAALDIALRRDGRPVLIEYNIGGFSPYFYHFTGQTIFGEYTAEVVDYCARRLNR